MTPPNVFWFSRRIMAIGVSSDFNLDPTWLFLSLIPSGVGFVLLVYGKKQARITLMLSGIAFMAYPYFTPSVTALVAIGVLLGVATWLAVRAGW